MKKQETSVILSFESAVYIRQAVYAFSALRREDKFIEQLKKCTTIHKTVAHINLRNEEIIYAGNRFMVYALFPQINISFHEIWGKNKRNVVFAAGKSIFNRTSKMNIGEFMLRYGGGGHIGAGTCQVPIANSDKVRDEIITAMIEDV